MEQHISIKCNLRFWNRCSDNLESWLRESLVSCEEEETSCRDVELSHRAGKTSCRNVKLSHRAAEDSGKEYSVTALLLVGGFDIRTKNLALFYQLLVTLLDLDPCETCLPNHWFYVRVVVVSSVSHTGGVCE